MLIFTRKKQKNTLGDVHIPTTGIYIQDEERLRQLAMISITPSDLQRVRRLKPQIEQNIDRVMDPFYEPIMQTPALQVIIQANTTLEKLKRTLQDHVIELFDGRIDQSFIRQKNSGCQKACSYRSSFKMVYCCISSVAVKSH